MKFRDKKKEFYSLRKYKGIGLASALVGLAFLSPSVMAEEVATPNTATGDVSVVSPTPENDKVSETSENTGVATTTPAPEVAKEESVANETVVTEESSKPTETDKPVDTPKPVVDSPKVESPKLEEVPTEKQTTNGGLTDRSNEPAVTESSQPVRSRRGKRDVSGSDESSTGTIKLFDLDGNNDTLVPATGRKAVTVIDYTDGSNPQKAPVGGNYNNQISKIEILDPSESSSGRIRVRISLKDGETIPEGGKLQLASLGAIDFPDNRLLMNSTVVGLGYISDGNLNNKVSPKKELESNLESATTVEGYLSILKGLKRFDYPVSMINLTMNSSFSSYDKNRVLEFEFNTVGSKTYDSLELKNKELSSDGIYNSSGSQEKPLKETLGYLINPYDNSKIINLKPFKGSITVYTPSEDTRIVKDKVEMSIKDSSDSFVPYFLTSTSLPALHGVEINGGVPSTTRNRLSVGDYFNTTLTSNSIFKPNIPHKVGDVVEVSVNNYSPSKTSVESKPRFSDTDKYVVEKTSYSGYSEENTKVRLRLVELTDTTIKWELLDDIKLTKDKLGLYFKREFFNYSLREDWVDRFGKDSLLNYLKSGGSVSDYADGSKFKLTSEFSENGTPHSEAREGSIERNPNIVWGDKSTGSVKVKYVLDTGELLKEVNLAENKPWDTRVTVDLPPKFGDAMIYRTSEAGLSNTIVGTSDRLITVTYKKPTRELANTEPPKVVYKADETKETSFRKEVVGTPKTYTRIVTYDFDESRGFSTDNEDYEVDEGTPTVITLGTKPTTEVTYRDFDTRYVEDPTRTAGEKFTETEGVRGTTTTTTTYSLNEKTGVVTPTKGQPVVVAPQDAVIKVGTKPKVETQTIEITTKYIEDANLEAGKEVEVEKGSAGRTVTTTNYFLNPIDGTVTADEPTVETTPMVQRVVNVGIKPNVVETPVNFTTRYERDDTAEAGKKTTTVTGVNGKVTTTTTYTLSPTTGKVTENTTSVKKEPTSEVVKVGTKPKVVVETWRVLPRYQEDPTKSAGSKVTLVEGSDGIKTTTTPYELNTSDGSVTEGAATVKIIQPNVKVIGVGTKPKVSVTNIPYTVGYEANPEAEAGVSSTKVAGVDGKVTTTTTYTLNPKNGEVTPNEPTLVRTEPVNEVISVGAKSNTFVIEQDYGNSYVEDASKEVGFKEVRTKGTKGSTTYTTTYSVDPNTGEVSSKELEPKVVAPTDEVVVLGTKPSVVVTNIPKTVRYVKDLEKEKGVTTVSVEGSDGSITTTTTYTVNSYTGDVSPNTPTSVKVPAVDKVVMVGAKTEVVHSKDDKGRDVIDTTTYSVNPKTGKVTPSTVRTYGTTKEPTVETRVVPAPVRYEKDSSKDKGTPPVTVKGIDGEETITTTYVVDKTTGKITVVVGKPVRTKEPKETVVKVPAKDKVIVTPIESTVVYVKDPTRVVGEPDVTIPGSNGSKTVTITYTVNPKTGEITETVGSPAVKPAKDTIIKVASKDKVEYYRNMGSVIRRTTSYTVNPKTGAVTPVTPVKEELVSSVPNDAPVVDLPEYTEPIGTTPNDAPVLDIPEFTGGVNPYDAPQVEKPEFKGGVTPNDAPVHELPEFRGGVVPNDAPVLELPELKVPEEPAKPQPTNVGGKVEEATQTLTQEPVQEAQLPNTGGGDSAKASALGIVSFLAGLGIASRKRKED